MPNWQFGLDDFISMLGWLVAVFSLAATIRRDSNISRKEHDVQVQKSEHLAGQMETLSNSIERLQKTLDKVDGLVTEDRNLITQLQEQNKTIFTRVEQLEKRFENHISKSN